MLAKPRRSFQLAEARVHNLFSAQVAFSTFRPVSVGKREMEWSWIMLRQLLLAAAVMIVPAGSAYANDDNDNNYQNSRGDHRQDHREHRGFHGDVNEEHEEAHDEGFYSRRDHKRYHREVRRDHNGFHYEYPNTRHREYRNDRRYRNYRNYRNYRGW